MSQGTSVEDIRSINLPPARTSDFNDELLAVGDHVLFALMRGVLAEGTVVAIDEPPGSVTIKSLKKVDRSLTVSAAGAIKVSE